MSLFKELKRRNVFRVAIAYLVAGWLLVQVLGIATDSFEAPAWVMKLIITLIVIGFIPTVLFSWAFELTPEGIKKEKDVIRDDSITSVTAKKLDIVTIVALFVVGALVLWQQFDSDEGDSHLRGNDDMLVEDIAMPNKNTASPSQAGIPSIETDDLEINNKSIAVLPFTNMANSPDNEPLTLGLHDDLLTHVSKISALKVISRTSVMEYKSTTKNIKQIAAELGVANILEGGVQRAGNQIRINVQLINAQTDEHLWAEIYDRELTASNIFKIQTEISKEIAAALKAQLSPEEQQSLAQQDTDNLEAYSAYLAGRQLILNRNSVDLKQALKKFERASELDPDYAKAYVGQALTWNLLHGYSDITYQEKYAIGEPLIDKALSISPSLAEAHAVKGLFLQGKNQFVDAEKSYQRAIHLNPNESSAYHWYSNLLRNALARPEEALVQIKKAAELNPMSPIIQGNVGASLLTLDRVDEALIQYRFLSDFAPEFQGGPKGIAAIHINRGQFDQAIQWQKETINRDEGNVSEYENLAYLYLDLQALSQAKQVADTVKVRFPNASSHYELLTLIALYEGQHERTLELVQKYITIEGDDPDNQIFQLFMEFFAGNYQNNRDMLLPQLKNNAGQWVPVNTNNDFQFLVLSWCLQQLSEADQAQSIVDHIEASQPNWEKRENLEALYHAIQDKHTKAAKVFARMVERMDVHYWWIFLQQPMLDEMKKTPTFIKAHKQLMDELKKQRENLETMEAQGAAL